MLSGNDCLDITDLTPSCRYHDQHIELLNGFNIDDIAAQQLSNGTLSQNDGRDIYTSIVQLDLGSMQRGSLE